MKRICFYLILTVILTSLLGVKACQRDYDFASKVKLGASISPSPSGSVSASPSATDDSEESPTESPSESASTALASATPLISPSAVASIAAVETDKSFLKELKEQAPTINNTKQTENWLGKLYDKDEAIPGSPVDTDGDGYSDLLEKDSGTNPNDKVSFPIGFRTILSGRFVAFDSDYDGIPNSEESQRGSDYTLPDSDKDGFNDGAEVLSKTDLLDANSKPADMDGDGLSTDFENLQGTNPKNSDTDGDSLRDDTEFAIGTDPNKTDSDYDGILDGKEVEIGSDPTIAEIQ